MKILFVAPYAPVPPTFGGALRIYHLLKQAAARHDVSLIAYGGNTEYQLLRDYFGNTLRNIYLLPSPWMDRYRRMGQLYSFVSSHSFFHHLIYSREMQRLIDRIVEEEKFDIIQTEFAVLGAFDFKTDAVKILDAHNVEYDNFLRMSQRVDSLLRRIHYRREYEKFFHEEVTACRKHDALFVTSHRDRQILQADVPSVPKYIIPNGVDTEYFSSSGHMREKNAMVFTGMMGYVPNYDGMMFFLDEIFPLVTAKIPDAKIYIVGSKPPKILQRRESEHVIVTKYVNDVRPFIDKASVYVVPLRMGGGTRLKILEAMAMRIPIVTTAIGCEGIEVHDNETVLVRDDPQSFADAIIELMFDDRKKIRLVEQSFEKVRTTYDWSIIGGNVERHYNMLTGAGRTNGHDRTKYAAEQHSVLEYQQEG